MANFFELPRYIAIEGPIRVGKSTLAQIIATQMNAQRVIEPEDNKFLKSFYEGESGAAFQTQFQKAVIAAGPQSNGSFIGNTLAEGVQSTGNQPIAPNYRSPYSFQLNAGIEREIRRELTDYAEP